MGVQRRPGGGWQLTIGRSPLDVRYIYAPSAGRPLPSARAGRLIFDFGGGLTVSLEAVSGEVKALVFAAAATETARGGKLAFAERGDLAVLTFGPDWQPTVRPGQSVRGAETIVVRQKS